MREIELKFGLTEPAAVAVDAALRRRGATTAEIGSRYWDSADRRLARAALSLRLRRTADGWEQTVKCAAESPVDRLEETVPRPGDWSEAGPTPELWLHAGSGAGALLDDALAKRGGRVAPLELVHTTRVRRSALSVEISGAELEIALDRGVVEAAGRSSPVCEVEVELKHGAVGALVAVGRTNIDSHRMWLSTISKAMRGGRLAEGAGAPVAVKAKAPRLARGASGREIFRAVLRSCLDQVLANASLLADGDVDDEIVHQLRVGIRRLRTARRELGIWRGSLGDAWEAPAADVFRKLGEHRDRKTVAASMRPRLAAAGSPDPALRPASDADGIDPVALVRDAAFQHALLDLVAFLLEPDDAADPGTEAASNDDCRADKAENAEQVVARHLDKLYDHMKRDAKDFEKLDEQARHAVRKRLKRLRYLSELVAPMYKRGCVKRFLAALEPAQDELGRYVDLLVATRLAHEVVDGGDARAWFNVGWFKAQEPRAIERCARCLRRVVDAEPYWR
ncbi:MAG: CYTH and CHAD domain-containing protein [Telluria sp.]